MRNFNVPKPLHSLSLMAVLGYSILAGDHASQQAEPQIQPKLPVLEDLPIVQVRTLQRGDSRFDPRCDYLSFAAINPDNPKNINIRIESIFRTVEGLHRYNTATFDFGDGTTDTVPSLNTYHKYENPGRYVVQASFTVIAEQGVMHPTDYEPIKCPPQVYIVDGQ